MVSVDAQAAGLVSWSQDVRAAMRRLDATQRRVIRLIYFERRTQQQVAEELHMPRKTVARAASTGLQALTSVMLGSGIAAD